MNGYYRIMPLGWPDELERLRKEQRPQIPEIQPTADVPEMPYWIVPEPVPSIGREKDRPEISDCIIIDMNQI